MRASFDAIAIRRLLPHCRNNLPRPPRRAIRYPVGSESSAGFQKDPYVREYLGSRTGHRVSQTEPEEPLIAHLRAILG